MEKTEYAPAPKGNAHTAPLLSPLLFSLSLYLLSAPHPLPPPPSLPTAPRNVLCIISGGNMAHNMRSRVWESDQLGQLPSL